MQDEDDGLDREQLIVREQQLSEQLQAEVQARVNAEVSDGFKPYTVNARLAIDTVSYFVCRRCVQ